MSLLPPCGCLGGVTHNFSILCLCCHLVAKYQQTHASCSSIFQGHICWTYFFPFSSFSNLHFSHLSEKQSAGVPHSIEQGAACVLKRNIILVQDGHKSTLEVTLDSSRLSGVFFAGEGFFCLAGMIPSSYRWDWAGTLLLQTTPTFRDAGSCRSAISGGPKVSHRQPRGQSNLLFFF